LMASKKVELVRARHSGESQNPCAWKQAQTGRCKSSSGRCPLPVAKGNCVTVRWGGKQPAANMQSVAVWRTRFGRTQRRACGFKVKSRPGPTACPRLAKTPSRTERSPEATGSWEPITLGGQRRSGDGARQVFGDGMRGSLRHVNQGDLSVQRPMCNRADRRQSVHSSEEAG
jgi:hypothetical protein